MKRTAFLVIALGLLCSLVAAINPIGMAFSGGTFRVDHSRVQGNSTLFDGSMIETESAISRLHLKSGAQVQLGAESRATVYQRKLILDYGQLAAASAYEVQAHSLHITPATADGLARIQVRNQSNVQVAAVRGSVRVTNAAGVLVANIEAGKTMSFEPQAAANESSTRVTGCLLSKGGKLIVAEQTANVILEVRGAGLEKEIGNRVEVSGVAMATAPTVPGASQIVNVSGVRLVTTGGCAAIAKKVGAVAGSGTVAAAGGAGISMGTIAVIGGVAAAASLSGLAVVGALPGQGSSSSVSR